MALHGPGVARYHLVGPLISQMSVCPPFYSVPELINIAKHIQLAPGTIVRYYCALINVLPGGLGALFN